MDMAELVRKYLAIREKKRELEREIRSLNEVTDKLEAVFARHLEAMGAEAVRAGGATVYASTYTSVTSADRLAFEEYVKQTGRWELVDFRPLKTAVEEFVENTGEVPPGVNVSKYKRINVRMN
jgi:hypothetical protein